MSVTITDECEAQPEFTISVYSDEKPLLPKYEPSAILHRVPSTATSTVNGVTIPVGATVDYGALASYAPAINDTAVTTIT